MGRRLFDFLCGFKVTQYFLILNLLLFASGALAAPVFLFGGGNRPSDAVADFVKLGGNRFLILTWATSLKQETFEAIKIQLLEYNPAIEVLQATEPTDKASKLAFLIELNSATAIYLSGGDQNQALDLVQKFDLFDAFRNAQQRGAVFAGTSAGTAMLPNLAMTGEADLTKLKAGNTVLREGLGLVPFLVDQHFLKRQRQNRLMSALIDHPEFKGVGVDEDNAVRFEDGNLEAYGESPAMIYSYDRSIAQFCVGILQGGQMEPLN